MAMVEKAHDELRSNFVDILGVLSSIIEAREGGVAGHSRRIAHLAHLLALELGLSEPQAEAVRVASLLHDIGKVGLPDPLIGRPFAALTREERDTVMQHPVIGEAMLMSLHSMHDVGTLIRSHHEHYDGSGFPDGLRGGAIPIGARILAVVSDYDLLRSGRLLIDRLDDKQAQHYLTGRRGTHYDPTVVDAFCHLLKSLPEGYDLDEAPVTPEQLQAGMRLSRDMLTRTGMVLLHKGKVIDEALAAKIRSLARNADTGIKIWVVRTPSSPDTPPQSSA
jgi:putative nucleotidyltransferase with HDIG domain